MSCRAFVLQATNETTAAVLDLSAQMVIKVSFVAEFSVIDFLLQSRCLLETAKLTRQSLLADEICSDIVQT
jgi:hypothetical protein